MTSKKGFLLIELITGVLLFSFFMLIVAEYALHVRTIEHVALQHIEALSRARNILEKLETTQEISTESAHEKTGYSVIYAGIKAHTTEKKDAMQWKELSMLYNKKHVTTLVFATPQPHERK